MSSIANQLINLQNNTALVNFQQGQDRLSQGNGAELDKNSFLQLLMAQIANQDPTNPMDQSQMLQQQAAFTQIEELQNLTNVMQSNNQLMQASNLVGKHVIVTDEFQNQTTITVDSVMFDDTGNVVLRHGDNLYAASQIEEILSGPPVATPPTAG